MSDILTRIDLPGNDRFDEDEGVPCPNCGQPTTYTHHQHIWQETHGLDCGPYEQCHQEWLTCDKCGAETTTEELIAQLETA